MVTRHPRRFRTARAFLQRRMGDIHIQWRYSARSVTSLGRPPGCRVFGLTPRGFTATNGFAFPENLAWTPPDGSEREAPIGRCRSAGLIEKPRTGWVL